PGVGERWPTRNVDLLDRRCRASGTQALSAACIDARMHEPRAPGARVTFGKGRRHYAIEGPGRVLLLAMFGMLRVEGEAKRPADLGFANAFRRRLRNRGQHRPRQAVDHL